MLLSADGTEVYQFGIVDYLQIWDMGKKTSKFFSIFSKEQSTTVDATAHSKRLQDFVSGLKDVYKEKEAPKPKEKAKPEPKKKEAAKKDAAKADASKDADKKDDKAKDEQIADKEEKPAEDGEKKEDGEAEKKDDAEAKKEEEGTTATVIEPKSESVADEDELT